MRAEFTRCQAREGVASNRLVATEFHGAVILGAPASSRAMTRMSSLIYSPGPHQQNRVVALEEIEQQLQLLGARTCEIGIAGEGEPRLVARRL